MGQIEGNKGDLVWVEIKDAFITKHEQDGVVKPIVKLVGEAEDGSTGTAALWMDSDICQQGLDSKVGHTNAENAMADLTVLGVEDGNIRTLYKVVGKRCQFYVSPKEKDGKVRYNYYLQLGGDVRLDLEEGAALIEAMLGKTATTAAPATGMATPASAGAGSDGDGFEF